MDTKDLQAHTAAVKENIAAVKELAASRLQPALQRQKKELQSFQSEVDGIFKNVFSGIERDFQKTLDFRTIARNGLERTLSQIQNVVERSISQTIQQAVSGNGGSNPIATLGSGLFSSLGKAFGSFFGGARESGGPVMPGRAFLVGERGPELFVPPSSGTIAPSSGNIHITMQVSTPDVQSFRASQGQLIADAAQAMRRARRNL